MISHPARYLAINASALSQKAVELSEHLNSKRYDAASSLADELAHDGRVLAESIDGLAEALEKQAVKQVRSAKRDTFTGFAAGILLAIVLAAILAIA